MFRVERHLWRTADGLRLVPSGHPEAAFLAFPAGTEMSDAEARRQGLLVAPPAPAEKSRARGLDKMAPRSADKGATRQEEVR